ncbi:hypothetical protein BKA70DRAFT_1218620 [Coprinopsis sp. MPI-PUGE-AT-0042]|nr:hypothetical protein BKA70DRAFT_1218620 [Coprinopsis sp. MPI-PUGE-AT-0042]
MHHTRILRRQAKKEIEHKFGFRKAEDRLRAPSATTHMSTNFWRFNEGCLAKHCSNISEPWIMNYVASHITIPKPQGFGYSSAGYCGKDTMSGAPRSFGSAFLVETLEDLVYHPVVLPAAASFTPTSSCNDVKTV